MNHLVSVILEQFNLHPVLADVGSSGAPPAVWDPIAARSIYIGFDPDLRELKENTGGRYLKTIILNEAVTDDNSSQTKFYLTRSPFCSSTLKPLDKPLADYIFADLFAVDREVWVPCAPLATVAARLGLRCIDWLKVDSQGTDLRIFQSLPPSLRDQVLALDVEPGLIDAYEGEDSFLETHKKLTSEGFWLADLGVCGTVRMRQSTLNRILGEDPGLHYHGLERGLKTCPGWCNAAYLCTLERLAKCDAPASRYELLWVFAILQGQLGFALDVAFEYEQRFGDPEKCRLLRDHLLAHFRTVCRAPAGIRLRRKTRRLWQFLTKVRHRSAG